MSDNDESKKQEKPGQNEEKPVKEASTPAKEATLTLTKAEFQKWQDDLAKSAEEAAKWKNEYYLSLADTQNLRKSLQEDHREGLRYRAEGFLDKLLPALDSFYLALSVSPQSDEAKNYQQGFQYIYNQLQAALVDEGVSEILPKIGETFDPALMHAVDLTEGEKEGLVAKVYSKGYKLHDRLVRPAMVTVTKKATQPVDEKEKKDSEATKA